MGILWHIFMGPTFKSYSCSNRRWTCTMLWRLQLVGNSETSPSFSICFVCDQTPSWHCVEVLTLQNLLNSLMILRWGVTSFRIFINKIKGEEDCNLVLNQLSNAYSSVVIEGSVCNGGGFLNSRRSCAILLCSGPPHGTSVNHCIHHFINT